MYKLTATKCYIAAINNDQQNILFLTLVDCKHSDWEEWGTCNKSCGNGSKSRNRRILVKAANGGIDCNSTTETTVCNIDPCSGSWLQIYYGKIYK